MYVCLACTTHEQLMDRWCMCVSVYVYVSVSARVCMCVWPAPLMSSLWIDGVCV